ncbi:hypothetical protein Dimus_004802 [Dionaea muscipula]
MSQKRQQGDGGDKRDLELPCSSVEKRPKVARLFQEVMQINSLQKMLVPILEPLIRRVVKEEVEQALTKPVHSFQENCRVDVFPSESRNLQLKFLNTLSLPVFTGNRIEGEGGNPIKIALVSSLTGDVVEVGSESSAKIEIVVLEGNFDSEGENWTQEEFQNYIVREREGKKSLLAGDLFVNLNEGVGLMGEISFTDNSSWTRSRRFRLGARLVGKSDGPRIREAKTDPFIVRDHRGELYKKHYPPTLSDEVWRLEKIGKDGAFHKRLNKEHVKSVREFLILLHVHPAKLRTILGSGMSARMWEVTVEHAQTCVIDKRVFLYTYPSVVQGKGVAFNEVGKVIGLFSETQYLPADELSENEKIDAQKLVASAFQNRERVISFEDVDSFLAAFLQAQSTRSSGSSHRIESSSSSSSKLLPCDKNKRHDYMQPNVFFPDSVSPFSAMGCIGSSDNYILDAIEGLDLRFDQPPDLPPQVTNPVICDTESMARAFLLEDNLGVLDTACSIQSPNPMLESHFELQTLLSSLPESSLPGGARRRRWKMLFSVLQLFFLMRIVVRRTNGKEIERS